jgi:hypothetical protein
MKVFEVFETKPLEPYNVKGNCPKCGCAFIESKYDRQHDVMVRKCPCGYTWREAPLDRKTQS